MKGDIDMSKFIKEELMVSNNYVEITTFLIDVIDNQSDILFTKEYPTICRSETISICGKRIKVQAARLYDAICDDETTSAIIANLELTDLATFINYSYQQISNKFIHSHLYNNETSDELDIARLHILEVISSIICAGYTYNSTNEDDFILSKGLYRDKNARDLIDWYEKESNTDAP